MFAWGSDGFGSSGALAVTVPTLVRLHPCERPRGTRIDDPAGTSPAAAAGVVGGGGRGAVRRTWRAAVVVVPARSQDARRGGRPVVGDVGAGGGVPVEDPRVHAR